MTPEEIEKFCEGKVELEIIIQGGDELRKKMGDRAYMRFEDKIANAVGKVTPDTVCGFGVRSESWINPKPLSNRNTNPKYRELAGLPVEPKGHEVDVDNGTKKNYP